MLHGCRWAALAALTLPIAGIAPAGETPGELSLAEVERVRLVLLPTNVTTRQGKPVRDLRQEDFRLSEDGVPQSIGFFATEESAPISLAFLLDVSGSMKLGDRLDQAKQAIRTFIAQLDPDDRIGLICFANDQVNWVSEFTSDKAAFSRRLDVQQAAGKTAVYDALAASPGLVQEGTRGRKAIVLITDGLDNASELPTLRAVWLARRVNVPIYSLSFIPTSKKILPKRAREALRVIRRFSTETGGALYPVHSQDDLTRATARIQSELRSQYVIGYYPQHEDVSGAFRSVKLTAARQGLKVRTRTGYYAKP